MTLAPGAFANYPSSYAITQADLDGKGGGDGNINNTATADSNETDPIGDSVAVPLVDSPAIAIEKQVSVNGGVTWFDADTPTGPIAYVGNSVQFRVIVSNTGNVALTNVTVVDTGYVFTGVPSSLAAGQSITSGVVTTTAVVGQQLNTATASGGFVNAQDQHSLT